MVKKIVIGILGMGMLFSQQSCIGNTPDKTTKEQAWKEFANPQDSTRTKVWWFHGETETTREGITADLEAYKRGGVGGVVYYDQAHGKGEMPFPPCRRNGGTCSGLRLRKRRESACPLRPT